MGCVSSKFISKEIKEEILFENGDSPNHVVSLTSSTYGVLKLEEEIQRQSDVQSIKECVVEVKKSPAKEDSPEIIDCRELMEGLEEAAPVLNQPRRSPKSRFLRGLADVDVRSPLKFLNQMGSPRKSKKFGGKENRTRGNGTRSLENSPKTVLKECNLKENSRKPSPKLWASIKGSPNVAKCSSFRIDSGKVSTRRRCLGPLFDPELVASFEKEVSEEEEQIKKMVSETPRSRKSMRYSEDPESLLKSFKEKTPPGGENAIVIYTTTLRGIRKTFEDCNKARSIIESHCVQMFERDVSMHSGFKEELRGLMGSKNVKVPLVFVKGRLIGGADEMAKLEEEGKLDILFSGIPGSPAVGCDGCGGVRFVMCMECNGSCKVLGDDGKRSVKCSECNENGLIQCPICC